MLAAVLLNWLIIGMLRGVIGLGECCAADCTNPDEVVRNAGAAQNLWLVDVVSF